jgi:large subunit ribosomal protein L3
LGHRKYSAPRRGSLGFRPRKRASRLLPRVRSWPEPQLDRPTLLGFIGYKVGMTHAIIIDDREGSPTYGREIFAPVTVVETPPIIPLAFRVYSRDPNRGLYTLTEGWIEPPKDLEIYRKISTFRPNDLDRSLKLAMDAISKISRVSVIVATQPKLVGGLEKKKPDILEIAIGGSDIHSRLEYASKILGNQVKVSEVFTPGMFIDVIGVTKGKGFQGVIKRFGVKELPRWHKHRKGSRKVGARSPAMGALSEVPQAGQMGFHRRTEYNKRILKIGSDPKEINPQGGFPHYGLVRSDYLLIHGSLQGTPKRSLVLRYPIRKPPYEVSGAPRIVYISLEPKM